MFEGDNLNGERIGKEYYKNGKLKIKGEYFLNRKRNDKFN